MAILAQARRCVSASSRWAARVSGRVVHRTCTGFHPVIEYTTSLLHVAMISHFLIQFYLVILSHSSSQMTVCF